MGKRESGKQLKNRALCIDHFFANSGLLWKPAPSASEKAVSDAQAARLSTFNLLTNHPSLSNPCISSNPGSENHFVNPKYNAILRESFTSKESSNTQK